MGADGVVFEADWYERGGRKINVLGLHLFIYLFIRTGWGGQLILV